VKIIESGDIAIRIAPVQIAAEAEIVGDREAREQTFVFRNIGDAARRDEMGGQRVDHLSGERNRPTPGFSMPAMDFKQRRFARAIGSGDP